jgi:hypothetical protein
VERRDRRAAVSRQPRNIINTSGNYGRDDLAPAISNSIASLRANYHDLFPLEIRQLDVVTRFGVVEPTLEVA